MFEHDEVVLPAFDAALEKLAVAPLLQRALQRSLTAGGLGAVGATGGGALGGIAGGIRGYRQAREEGGSALGGALGGATRGLALGAGAGLAAGGLAGAAGGARAQQLVRSLSAQKGRLGGISRFGERQVHSLTGALPEGMSRRQGMRAIGAGAGVDSLRKQLSKVPKGADPKHIQQRARLEKAIQAGEKVEELGITSVPGLFKALATKPGEALKASAGHMWHGSPSAGGKALSLGLPAAFVGSELARSSKPGEDSRLTRGLRAAGETAAYTVAPIGLLGASVLGAGAGTAGTGIGRLLSRRQPLGTSPTPPVPEDASASGNVERIYSPAAQGRPPEGIV